MQQTLITSGNADRENAQANEVVKMEAKNHKQESKENVDFKLLFFGLIAMFCSYLMLCIPVASAFEIKIYDNGNYKTTPLKTNLKPEDYVDIKISIELTTDPENIGLDNIIVFNISDGSATGSSITKIHFYRCLSRNVTECLENIEPITTTENFMDSAFGWAKPKDYPNIKYLRSENFLTLVEVTVDGKNTIFGFWNELYRETTSSIYHYKYSIDSLDLYVKSEYTADDIKNYISDHKTIPMTYIDRVELSSFKDANSQDASKYNTKNIYKASGNEIPSDLKTKGSVEYLAGNKINGEDAVDKYTLAFPEGEDSNLGWLEIASPVIFERLESLGSCGDDSCNVGENNANCCIDCYYDTPTEAYCQSDYYCDTEKKTCQTIDSITISNIGQLTLPTCSAQSGQLSFYITEAGGLSIDASQFKLKYMTAFSSMSCSKQDSDIEGKIKYPISAVSKVIPYCLTGDSV